MTSILQHDISDKIRHDLSGFGKITSLSGEVIDHGYSTPLLVNATATVGEHRIQCVNNDGDGINYFENGNKMTLPAPVGYFQDTPFNVQVKELVEAVENTYIQSVEEGKRRKKNWYACFFTWAAVIGVWDIVSDGQVGIPMLVALGLFAVGMLFNPHRPSYGFLGKPLVRDINITDEMISAEDREQFHSQLARFAARNGVQFAGELCGVDVNGTGFLIFSGTHRSSEKLRWFAVNSEATSLLQLRDYNPYMFTYKPVEVDVQEMTETI